MSTDSQNSTDQQASAQADASFQAVISAWKTVIDSLKLKFHSHLDLMAADFSLSMKAIVVAAISILLFVGLVLTLWATLMIAATYGLITLGCHWAICAGLIILIHLLALGLVKRTLSSAIASIPMQASSEALFSDTKA